MKKHYTNSTAYFAVFILSILIFGCSKQLEENVTSAQLAYQVQLSDKEVKDEIKDALSKMAIKHDSKDLTAEEYEISYGTCEMVFEVKPWYDQNGKLLGATLESKGNGIDQNGKKFNLAMVSKISFTDGRSWASLRIDPDQGISQVFEQNSHTRRVEKDAIQNLLVHEFSNELNNSLNLDAVIYNSLNNYDQLLKSKYLNTTVSIN